MIKPTAVLDGGPQNGTAVWLPADLAVHLVTIDGSVHRYERTRACRPGATGPMRVFRYLGTVEHELPPHL